MVNPHTVEQIAMMMVLLVLSAIFCGAILAGILETLETIKVLLAGLAADFLEDEEAGEKGER